MTLNKELHPGSDINRLHVSRMKGGKGFIGCNMFVKTEENSLAWNVKHHTEPLIVAVRISNTVPSENSTQHGQYVRQIENKDKSNT